MNILKLMTIADFFTLGNAASGFLSIIFSIEKNYPAAVIFLLIAVLLDFFDGKIARLFHSQGILGEDLDSLSDIVSFGIAPAVFGLMRISTMFAIFTMLVFVLCGILRLARFNASEDKKVFLGMPITLNGIIIPALFATNVDAVFYPAVFLASAMLMVSSFRIRKFF
jgi:CDP-diacylglycerol---serine O-phosphatidyltransferase